MNFAFGFPVAAINARVDIWYGLRSRIRSAQLRGRLAEDTHTSV